MGKGLYSSCCCRPWLEFQSFDVESPAHAGFRGHGRFRILPKTKQPNGVGFWLRDSGLPASGPGQVVRSFWLGSVWEPLFNCLVLFGV